VGVAANFAIHVADRAKREGWQPKRPVQVAAAELTAVN
jgi:hypothetical protein